MIHAKTQATAHRIGTQKARLEHLDMIRGLAALVVCATHIRSMLFGTVPHNWVETIFYFSTGVGGQAVMVFFALSGFLVGGPALQRIHEERWNFPDYSVHRFSRLWTGMIPALAMTALLDWFGRDVLRLPGYSGEYFGLIASGPRPGHPIDLGLWAFLGNAAFGTNIFAPIFGTNGPLWSLAFEFAYYFTVPLAWFAVRGGAQPIWRILAAIPLPLVILTYPFPVTGLGTIWVAGALVYLLMPRVRALPVRWFRLYGTIALLAVLLTFPLTLRFGHMGNAIFGWAWAAALPCLARLRSPGGLYGKTSFWLSEISFTLYVAHFPLALLLWLALFAPVQYALTPASFAIWLGLVAATLAYALVMWWLFERNTGRVRRAAQLFFRTV